MTLIYLSLCILFLRLLSTEQGQTWRPIRRRPLFAMGEVRPSPLPPPRNKLTIHWGVSNVIKAQQDWES